LAKPNDLHNPSQFWLDATSWLVRFGNYYAFKAQGNTGPVRRLIPLHPSAVSIRQDLTDPLAITYFVTFANGQHQEYTPGQILHARGPARDGFKGDSIVMDVAEAIALEIAAEKFGASYFGNGAMPGLVFKYAPGSMGFKTDEEAKKFTDDIQKVFAKSGRFKSLLVPKGIELGDPLTVDNDKAQFLATRQYQRTVIAGAFGVPPHLVGDLSKGTFNNVEQQSLAFVQNVVQPYVTIFEQAMEQSLLTDEELAQGIIIRFDIDAALRADFKTRQEGLNIQRNAGVINANEWRDYEGLNPISDEDGGEEYWRQGQSGQSAKPPTDDNPKPAEPEPTDDNADDGDEEDAND
jgi:HK97 family phage portal protein